MADAPWHPELVDTDRGMMMVACTESPVPVMLTMALGVPMARLASLDILQCRPRHGDRMPPTGPSRFR